MATATAPTSWSRKPALRIASAHYGGSAPCLSSRARELNRRRQAATKRYRFRAHLERILPVIDEAIRNAGLQLRDEGAVAVANRPDSRVRCSWVFSREGCCRLPGNPPRGGQPSAAAPHACRIADGRRFPLCGPGGQRRAHELVPLPLRSTLRRWAAPSTTPRARRLIRSPQCLGCTYPGGPSIERVAAAGNPRAYGFPALATARRAPRLQLQRPENGSPLSNCRPRNAGQSVADWPKKPLPTWRPASNKR